LNVLTPEEGLRLADSLAGVACMIVTTEGHVTRNEAWLRFERPRTELAAAVEPPAAESKPRGSKTSEGEVPARRWDPEFELVIDFEINLPDTSRRYRRPYVAVWVEDKDGFPVRNLELWVSRGGAGPFQWLPDLKRWYRADQERRLVDKTDMVDTISRATRPPGKYSLIWDGKDDQGRPLPQGEYTLFIDAAREHGTYQNIRKSLKVAATPFAEELKGNVEIKSARVEYRRRVKAK